MPKSPNPTLTNDACRLVLRECGSFNLRKTSRAVTQLYDDILQPSGLRSTQVVVLVILVVEQESSVAGLARQLLLSPSTLSRNLRPLERDGLVKIRDSNGRGKSIRLTARGRKSVINALPYWKKAQKRFTDMVGATAWSELNKQLAKTIRATQN